MEDGHHPSVRVQVTWLRSRRNLQEGDHLWQACCVPSHESLHIALLVYGGSSSAGHYLEILLLERLIHGVIRMSPYVLNSWY